MIKPLQPSAMFSYIQQSSYGEESRGDSKVYRHELGKLVSQGRQELGLSIRAAARDAGVDRATWTALEEGSRVTQDRHYAGIERALEWPVGTIRAIVAGEHPSVTASTPTKPDLRDDNERRIWSMDAVDEDLRREYIRLYRERQRKNTKGEESA